MIVNVQRHQSKTNTILLMISILSREFFGSILVKALKLSEHAARCSSSLHNHQKTITSLYTNKQVKNDDPDGMRGYTFDTHVMTLS